MGSVCTYHAAVQGVAVSLTLTVFASCDITAVVFAIVTALVRGLYVRFVDVTHLGTGECNFTFVACTSRYAIVITG